MEGEIKLDGHSQTGIRLVEHRASGNPVGHVRAGPDVLAVVIGPVVFAMDAVRDTGKPCIVLGPDIISFNLHIQVLAGLTGRTASEPYCIGIHGAPDGAAVVKRDHTLRSLAFLEVERTEVEPGAAAHPLVHVEGGCAA